MEQGPEGDENILQLTLPEESTLDPYLVQAVIQTESAGNPYAVSSAGAKGLMQLMDATGLQELKRSKRAEAYNPYDPQQNFALGTQYLERLSKQFKDPRLAVAAYNTGEERVADLQRQYGQDYDLIEPHLYDETKAYVPKVMGEYTRLKGSEPLAPPVVKPSDYAALPDTQQGFAKAVSDRISNPDFELLPFEDKAATISQIYNAKPWGKEAYGTFRETMNYLWDGTPDREHPNVGELIGPPPILKSGDNPKEVFTNWKDSQIQNLLYSGVDPAVFGNKLDEYFNSTIQNETEAFNQREGGLAYHAGGWINQVTQSFFKPGMGAIAGIYNLAGHAISKDNLLTQTADAINASMAVPPSKAFTYELDEYGDIKQGQDGYPITRTEAQIADWFGSTMGFLAGGTILRGMKLGTLATTGLDFGANYAFFANDSFDRVYKETGGDTKKAYTAALFDIPAAGVAMAGQLGVLSKIVNPAVDGLSSFNKALYIADASTRHFILGGASMGAASAISQAGQQSQLGGDISWPEVFHSAIGAGAASAIFGWYGASRTRLGRTPPPPVPEVLPREEVLGLPAPETNLSLPGGQERLGLPNVREGQLLLPAPGTLGPETGQSIRQPYVPSQEQINKVTEKLQKFQYSDAAAMNVTLDEARAIVPNFLEQMDLTLAREGDNVVIARKPSGFVLPESENIDVLTRQVTQLHQALNKRGSPENLHEDAAESHGLLDAYGQETGTEGKVLWNKFQERASLQQTLDAAKTSYEDETRPIQKKVKALDVARAEGHIAAFNDANPDVHEMWPFVGKTVESLNAIRARQTEALGGGRYVNKTIDMQNALDGALQKRALLSEKEALKNGAGEVPERGVKVEDHTVMKIDGKWYAVDPNGQLLGEGQPFYFDALKLVEQSKAFPERTTNPSTQFTIKDTETNRTKLTPIDENRIREQLANERASAEKVNQIKAETRKKAEQYRDKLYKEEVAQAKKKIAKAKRTVRGKEPPTSTITALNEEGVPETATVAEGTTVERKPTAPQGRTFQDRQPIATPRKPLSSNYTSPIDIKQVSEKEVPISGIYKAAQKLVSSLGKDTKIFAGGLMPRRAIGYLNYAKDFIKVATHDDPITLMHELMHKVDKVLIGKWDPKGVGDYSSLPKNIVEAAKDMSETYYPFDPKNPPSESLKVQEGFAKFFEHYTTGDRVRTEMLDWYHSQFAKDHPEVYGKMEDLKNLMTDYFSQTPTAYTQSGITERPGFLKRNVTQILNAEKWKTLQDRWYTRTQAFADLDRLTGNQNNLKDEADTYLRRTKNLVDFNMKKGRTDFFSSPEQGLPFDAIVKQAGTQKKALERYMSLMNDWADLRKGIQIRGNVKDLQSALDEIRKNPETKHVVDVANQAWEFVDHINSMAKQADPATRFFIEQREKANFEATGARHGYYFPAPREGFDSFYSGAKKTGSTRAKVEPISSMKTAFEQTLARAAQSRIKHLTFDLASGPEPSSIGLMVREVTGGERKGLETELKQRAEKALKTDTTPTDRQLYSYVSDVFDGFTAPDYKTFSYFDGKQLRFFETDPRVLTALSNKLPDFVSNPIFQALRVPALSLRTMATTFRPAFQAYNLLVRDPLSANLYIQAQLPRTDWKPAVALYNNVAKSLLDLTLYKSGIRKTGVSELMDRIGVMSINRVEPSREFVDMVTSKFGKGNVLNLAEAGLNHINDFLSIGEQATRQAAVRTLHPGIEKTALEKTLTPDQLRQFVTDYARSTVDFAEQGSSARVWNQIVPFFTARIAETSRGVTLTQKNPKFMLGYGLAALTLGMYKAFANKDNPEYQELGLQNKLNVFTSTIPVGGINKLLYIPFDSFGGTFFGLGQSIGIKATEDPKLPNSYVDMAKVLGFNLSPVGTPLDVFSPAIKESLQQFFNKDVYTDRQIVPDSLKYKDTTQQYNEYTSELAKRVGNELNMSPLRIDHAIRSIAPAVSDYLSFADKQLGYKKITDDYRGLNFFISAMTKRGPVEGISDKSMNLFQQALAASRATELTETFEEEQIRKQLERTNTTLSDYNTLILATDDEELKKELRIAKRELLQRAVKLSVGAEDYIAPSPIHKEAQLARKAMKTARREQATAQQEEEASKLQGSTPE